MTNPHKGFSRMFENLEKVAAVLASVPELFVLQLPKGSKSRDSTLWRIRACGGGTIVLYVDEIIRDELRPTKDVDCVVEIFSRTKYYRLATMLREAGLSECTEPDAPMCRWEYEELLIDIMPCGTEVLGFSNRWYIEGLKNLRTYILPSKREIYIFSPLYLLASKIEAFLGRGQSFYFSKDIEDIIVLLDSCEALPREFEGAEGEVKLYLQQWFGENRENIEDAVANFLPSSSVSREERAIELIQSFATINDR